MHVSLFDWTLYLIISPAKLSKMPISLNSELYVYYFLEIYDKKNSLYIEVEKKNMEKINEFFRLQTRS